TATSPLTFLCISLLYIPPPLYFSSFFFFFFNATATPEIYTLSLHDALPICPRYCWGALGAPQTPIGGSGFIRRGATAGPPSSTRSEEHTSELQSRGHLVCRLLLEKKKQKSNNSVQVQENKRNK